MSVNDWARLLIVLGVAFALAGPLIALIRVGNKYTDAMARQNTRAELNALIERARGEAKVDLRWTVIESSLVLLGVVLAAVASVILIP